MDNLSGVASLFILKVGKKRSPLDSSIAKSRVHHRSEVAVDNSQQFLSDSKKCVNTTLDYV